MSEREVNYDMVGYVESSRYREEIMNQLDKRPLTPSQIEQRTGSDIAHISRAMHALQEEGIVELLVSEDRKKGRVYGLTDSGQEVINVLKEWDDE